MSPPRYSKQVHPLQPWTMETQIIPTYVAQPHEPCVTFHQQMYGFPLMGDVPLTQDRAAVCSLWHLSVTQVMQHMQTPGKHLIQSRCLQNTLAGTCL